MLYFTDPLPRWVIRHFSFGTPKEERAVYAALIMVGRPATNDELAKIMNVSKSESSRRVAALNGHVHKVRVGREVQISLPKT